MSRTQLIEIRCNGKQIHQFRSHNGRINLPRKGDMVQISNNPNYAVTEDNRGGWFRIREVVTNLDETSAFDATYLVCDREPAPIGMHSVTGKTEGTS